MIYGKYLFFAEIYLLNTSATRKKILVEPTRATLKLLKPYQYQPQNTLIWSKKKYVLPK